MQLHELLYSSISKYDVCYGLFCGTFQISLIWTSRVRNPPKWKFGGGCKGVEDSEAALLSLRPEILLTPGILRTIQPAFPRRLRNFLLVLNLKQNKTKILKVISEYSVCVCACVVRVHTCMYVCMCARVCAHVCACMCVCTCVHVLYMSRSTAHICTCL